MPLARQLAPAAEIEVEPGIAFDVGVDLGRPQGGENPHQMLDVVHLDIEMEGVEAAVARRQVHADDIGAVASQYPGDHRERDDELAPALVNFGWKVELLEELKSAGLFDLSIQWLGTACLGVGLLFEVQHTTERISQIVHAMKSYTYLDQAPLLEVDIHEGLENTLIIMQHKLK